LNVADPDNPPSSIKGIGPVSENMLVHAGFLDVKSISETTPKHLSELVNITIKKATTWIKNAKEATGDIPIARKAFNFTKIEGIGPTYRNRIVEAGITSIEELLAKSVDEVAIITKTNTNKAEKLLNNAKNYS
jgi:predicted flap endonuclease-1-like 5' DNA nuclease